MEWGPRAAAKGYGDLLKRNLSNPSEYQTTRISTGAENITLYPKLKDQLRMENLQNISNKNPILKHAALGEGNLTEKGVFTRAEIEKLAKEWIGEGAIQNTDGGFTSADGTRKYRPPQLKNHSKYAPTGIQANFERIHQVYDQNKRRYVEKSESNLHLNVQE